MTTKDILKALPIEEKLKLQILSMFDYMEPSQRLTIERVAWNTYDALFDERLQENIQLQFMQVLENQEKSGKHFYDKALKRTEQQMTKEFQETMTKMDLATARQAMQKIMQEIQDAQKSK